MIFDAENMFCDKKSAVSAAAFYSDIVENSGGGDAYNPAFLFITVGGGNAAGRLEIALETSDTEDFKTTINVASYEILPVKSKLPSGLKKFMRLKLTSTFTAGKITAALVRDINL